MKKSYSKIDEFYAKSMGDFSTEDKIDYLENTIDKNQNILSKNGSLLSKLKRLIIVETVEAAQKEIKRLQEDVKTTNQINQSEINPVNKDNSSY